MASDRPTKGHRVYYPGAGWGTVTRVGSGPRVEWLDVRWDDQPNVYPPRVWFPTTSLLTHEPWAERAPEGTLVDPKGVTT